MNKMTQGFINYRTGIAVRGFTLVEVIVVAALIAIMSVIAIPMIFNWLPDYRLRSAARDVYSHMQKARMLAVSKNTNTAVLFNPALNRYQLCEIWNGGCLNAQIVDLNNSGSGIAFGHGDATKQAVLAGTAFPLAPDDNVSYSNNVVIFNSRGVSTAGYVYLHHQEQTTTYAVGSLSSGVIRILKWQGGDWE